MLSHNIPYVVSGVRRATWVLYSSRVRAPGAAEGCLREPISYDHVVCCCLAIHMLPRALPFRCGCGGLALRNMFLCDRR